MKTTSVASNTHIHKWMKLFWLLVLATFIMLQPRLFAQVCVWSDLYGGTEDDRGFSIMQTQDRGFIAVGYTSSFGFGFKDIYLVKTDSLGDTLWTQTYGGPGDDIGYSVKQTSDFGYIIAGETNSFGGFSDAYIIKTDANGTVLWTKIYGGPSDDYAYSICRTTDLGYVIVGYTYSFGVGSSDVYLIRTDADGDSLWTKTYGGFSFDVGMSVQETSDQGYIITGSTNSFGAGGSDVYLIRTDINGDTLWTRTYGGLNDEVGNEVQQTADLGFIVAGYTQLAGGEDSDLYLLKVGSDGGTEWEMTYSSVDYIYGYSVYQTSDEGYIVGGYSNATGGEDGDLYLMRTDSLGDSLWTRNPEEPFNVRIYAVQQTSDGEYIVCGYSDSPFGHGGDDLYIAKYRNQVVGTKEDKLNVECFKAWQSGSNPFKEQMSITYVLPRMSSVTVSIYNHLGQAIKTLLVKGNQRPGMHTIAWDGTDDSGKEVPSGIYFLKLMAGDDYITDKLIKLK